MQPWGRHRPALGSRGPSQGPGGWFLGFKGTPGSFASFLLGNLGSVTHPHLCRPPHDPPVWADGHSHFHQARGAPRLAQHVTESRDSISSSLAVVFPLPALSFPFQQHLPCKLSNWALTDSLLMPCKATCFLRVALVSGLSAS